MSGGRRQNGDENETDEIAFERGRKKKQASSQRLDALSDGALLGELGHGPREAGEGEL